MKSLHLEQMEQVNGGATTKEAIGCGLALVGFGLACVGLFFATAGVGVIIAAASYTIAPTTAALACL